MNWFYWFFVFVCLFVVLLLFFQGVPENLIASPVAQLPGVRNRSWLLCTGDSTAGCVLGSVGFLMKPTRPVLKRVTRRMSILKESINR